MANKYEKLIQVGLIIKSDTIRFILSKRESKTYPLTEVDGISLTPGDESHSTADLLSLFMDRDSGRSMAPSKKYDLTLHLKNGETVNKSIKDFDLITVTRTIEKFNKELIEL